MQSLEYALMGGAGFVWPALASIGYIPILIYLVSRWRLQREQAPADPQLGLKVALWFFRFLGFQAALIGLALAVWGMLLGEEDNGGTIMRVGLGFFLPGALVYLVHMLFMTKTNDADAPAVGRMFLGASVFVNGLVGTGALVGLGVVFAQKHVDSDALRFAFSLAIVFVTAWVAVALRFVRRVKLAAPW